MPWRRVLDAAFLALMAGISAVGGARPAVHRERRDYLNSFIDALCDYSPGETVALEVVRGRTVIEVEVTPGEGAAG